MVFQAGEVPATEAHDPPPTTPLLLLHPLCKPRADNLLCPSRADPDTSINSSSAHGNVTFTLHQHVFSFFGSLQVFCRIRETHGKRTDSAGWGQLLLLPGFLWSRACFLGSSQSIAEVALLLVTPSPTPSHCFAAAPPQLLLLIACSSSTESCSLVHILIAGPRCSATIVAVRVPSKHPAITSSSSSRPLTPWQLSFKPTLTRPSPTNSCNQLVRCVLPQLW
ncbi:hypothetical protein CRG98_018219 [Punica granatum]|uniref:Uncharacterized protein n=1 Tax=Punica granatum TaxID=22663 RepID=A0A2I0JYI0_PUNGR|nr:hypothetical protein CRG98_018219 [Punica granatum]